MVLESMGNIGSQVTVALSWVWAIIKIFPVFIAAAGVGGGIYYIFAQQKFKHRIIIKQITGSKKIVKEDTFRVLNKSEIPGILTKKGKMWHPYPPEDAIEVMSDGRMFVQIYETENGAYIYAKDVGDEKKAEAVENIPQEAVPRKNLPVGVAHLYAVDGSKVDTVKAIAKDAFELVIGLDRATIVEQFAKMEEKKKRNILESTILPLLPWIVPILLLVLLLAYYGNIATTLNGATQAATDAATAVLERTTALIQAEQRARMGIQDMETPVTDVGGPPR